MGEQPATVKPFIDKARVQELLEIVGIEFHTTACLYCGYPPHYPPYPKEGTIKDTPEQRLKFGAMIELITGAIAEWADVEEEPGTTTFETINNELNDWAESWLR